MIEPHKNLIFSVKIAVGDIFDHRIIALYKRKIPPSPMGE